MATNTEMIEKLEACMQKQDQILDMLATKKTEETAGPKDYFAIYNSVNVNEHTEQKNGLTYLSWAWAWAEAKKVCPTAMFKIYERDTEFGPCNYFTDGRTCWVKTGAIVDGLEYIEMLPVMDFKNRSIPYEAVTSMDVNKAIQRSLTKAFARHGIGLYIYAGEDLPEESEDEKAARVAKEQAALREQQEIVRLQKEVDVVIRKLLAGMTPEQRSNIANNVVTPAIGSTNYKNCKDKEKLSALLAQLNELAKAA